jgi:ABC-2 type transport system permease protein
MKEGRTLNIFLYETKAQMKSFLLWNVSLLALLGVFMDAFYDGFMQSREVVPQALNNFPPVFAAMFGVKLDTIFSYGGYYQFIYIYIGVVGAIMASLFAVSAFSREKRAKCVDFLLTKPVTAARSFS